MLGVGVSSPAAPWVGGWGLLPAAVAWGLPAAWSLWQMPTLPWAADPIHQNAFTVILFCVFLPGPGVQGDRNQAQ